MDYGSVYGDDSELPFDQFPVPVGSIDYLFLTHAHIDHIGRAPDLIDAGFRGEIICTHATRALLLSMPQPPKEIRLVRGEGDARRALADLILTIWGPRCTCCCTIHGGEP